jgi:iron(III) transport system permease protein
VTRRAAERIQFTFLVALLAAFVAWPLWLTVRGAFRSSVGEGWTLHHVAGVFVDPLTRAGLVNAVAIALCVVGGTLAIALPLALVLTRLDFAGRRVLGAALLLPLILPPFVGAIGLRHLLGREGAVNALLVRLGVVEQGVDFVGRGGFGTIVLLESLALFPIVYLNLAAALANVDPSLEEAARGLGAGRWTRLRRVVLPLARPGAFAGAAIVFIWSFTELGTPLMLEYRAVTSVQVFDGLKDMESSRRPYALVAVMLSIALLAYAVARWRAGSGSLAMQGKASFARRARRVGTPATLGCWALVGGVATVAALPHLATIFASLTPPGLWQGTLLPRAFTLDGWRQALGHPLAVGSIRNSLLLSTCAAVAATAVGLIGARLVVRGSIRGRGVVDAMLMLPLAVPGLVMAFGFVALSLEWPFGGRMPACLAGPVAATLPAAAGAWLVDAPLRPLVDILGADPNPFPLLAVAFAVRRMPYVARSAVAGLQQTSVTLEEAALGAGASRATMLRRVVLPLVAANVLAGALLAFSFSMLEVSDSLLLAQRERDYPVTKAIYTLYDRLGDGELVASAMGVWAMALLAVTLLGASALIGRRMGALFRA